MKMNCRAANPFRPSALFGGSCRCHRPICGFGRPVAPLPSNVLKGGFAVGGMKSSFVRRKIDWNLVYHKPCQPLAIDIGSGNGLFLLEMARWHRELNFLGLEINEKPVKRCLNYVHQYAMRNGFFVATNATLTFHYIISTYPGEVVLVSIQCPKSDFNDPDHKWRMLGRSLIEVIADLLAYDGKVKSSTISKTVFLQSDVEAVALRMKELFLKHGMGKLELVLCKHANNSQGWLDETRLG